MNELDCIVVEPQQPANASIIWLHGLGADGHDFAPLARQLKIEPQHRLRFIFPHAPQRAITFNQGMTMSAWYDFEIEGHKRKVNPHDLRVSCDQIRQLIEQETMRGIAPKRILLAGFSQGGAIAYDVAMNFEQTLAGLLVLSTYMADDARIKKTAANAAMPIHVFHGTQDQVVPMALAEQALQHLHELKQEYEFYTYAMAHSVCVAQIRQLAQSINAMLAE